MMEEKIRCTKEELHMSVLHVNKESFDKVIGQSAQTVLVDFWATWCAPCRMLAPILEDVATARPDIIVCKVDVDEERDLAMKYGVSSIPTLLVFKRGVLTNRSVGLIQKDEILGLL